jgi:CHAT domain-containing protein/tetratricopeptide (TPR) repeat protein
MLPNKRRVCEIARLVSMLVLSVSLPLLTIFFRVAEIPATSQTSSDYERLLEISPGPSIRRELVAGTKHVFTISVDLNHVFRFSIDKGDLVLATSVYSPTGAKLLEHVSQDFETVELSLPAQVAGTYRIELLSHDGSETPRHYEIKLHPLTPVTPENGRDSEARQAMAHAGTLRADWKETSFRQAVEHYNKAALIWTSISELASASHAAIKAGDLYFLLSEFEEAARQYQNAVALAAKTDDWLAQARALSHVGRLQSYQGNHDRAQEQLTKAVRLLEQHEANRTAIVANAYGEALTNLAEVSYSKGDFVKSSRQLDRALNVFQNNRKGEAKVHLFRGYIAGSIGETEKAVAEIAAAQELYRVTNDKIGEAVALTTLKLRHSRKGDESSAIETYHKAIEIFRVAGDRLNEARTLNALGQSHQNLGEYSIAINEYQKAFRLFQDIGAVDAEAVTTFQIAMAYDSSGDLDQALTYYERCLQLSRSAGNLRTEAHALSRITKIYVERGLHKHVAKQLKKVRKFYAVIGDLRGQAIALNAYGDFLFQRRQIPRALDAYRQALPFSEKVNEQGILISTLYNLARANLELDGPEAALPFTQRSLKIIEDVRADVESPEFRVSYFSVVRKHYDLCIQILMQLDRMRPGRGFAVEAFAVSERSRARLVLDLITESRINPQLGATSELIEDERRLRALIVVQAEYRMDLSLNKRDAAEIAEADRQMVQLRAEYQAVAARMRQQNPRLISLEQFEPVTLQQLQNELQGSDTMLLEYVLGEEHSYLFAVTSNTFQSYELSAAKVLEGAARESYKLITVRQGTDNNNYQADVKAADDAYPSKAADLSRMLLGPVAGQLENRRLLIVTEGALQYVSFEALPLPLQGASKLIETNEIVVLPSASTLIAIRDKRNRPSSPGKLLAVIADPVFSSSDDRVQSETASRGGVLAATDKHLNQSLPQDLERDSSLARLPHASEEADAISAFAPSGTTMVAKGFEASRDMVMSSDLGQYQIVHFATHGFLDNVHPELSSVVLTKVDRNGVRTNGLLPLHDIYSLDLSSELTVLSACQTALGKEIKGEGFVGLTHSFMSAGSKSVVASLWKVDDRATAVLMAEFYKGMLQKGMTPSVALRSAKLKMMRDKHWSAPYYWAGFVLQGEYTNHIAVDRLTWLRLSLVLLFFLVLIAATLSILRKRKRRISPSQFT